MPSNETERQAKVVERFCFLQRAHHLIDSYSTIGRWLTRPVGKLEDQTMTEISYALALLASITYGAADFLGGLAAKRSTTFSVVVVSQLAGLILMLLSLPFLPPASPTAIDIAWGVASGLAGGIGIVLLYRGLAIGVMSVVAPVTAVCAVIIPLIVGLGRRGQVFCCLLLGN